MNRVLEQIKGQAYTLLRKSEKYTKTDMVYLASGGFWGIMAQISAMAITLGLSIAMARFVPKDAYGTYKYVLGIVALLSVFSLNNVGTAVMQAVARGFTGAPEEGFKASLRWSFVVFLGGFALGAYYLLQGNATLGIGILLGGCASPFLASFNLYLPFFTGEKDFMRAAWYSGFVTNIVPAAALVAVALIDPRPVPLLAAYFIGNIAAAAYSYWRAIVRYRDDGKLDPEMLTYGKHLSFMGVLSGIAGNIDQILLFHFGGAIDLAIYNFAIGIVDQTKGPLKSLDSMMQARFAPQEETSIARGMQNKMFWLLGTAIVFILFYIAIAPILFHVLFPAYSVAIPYSQIYALSLLNIVTYPVGSYFAAKKRIRVQYLGTAINNVLQISIMVAGVIGWGLWGLIIGRVSARILTTMTSYLMYLWDVASSR